MSDDSFFREVDQELRQDQAKALWDRFGPFIIGAAVLVVLLTSLYVAWDYWTETRANRSGDSYSQALTLAEEGQTEQAMAVLQELEAEGYGAYPVLARMRAATLLEEAGDHEGAIAAFDEVADDGAIPDALRDMARLRAGLLLVDHGTYEDVAARLEALTAEDNPLRHSAREALGLAAWKEGRLADAETLFQQIADDQGAPQNIRQRAQLMLELIRGSAVQS